MSFQTGQAPTTCVVLPAPGSSSIFKLFVAWKPNRPDFMSVPQSVLEATINDDVEQERHLSHLVVWRWRKHPKPEPPSVAASLQRAVLSQPAETCEVLENGQLRLALSH